jgi:CRP-like cAMP-binding protein/ActR/RegA family two-component response regulator
MRYTILLVEDNPDMADNIKSILELAHYDVIQAANGKLGVECVQQYKPDLILCDIMMPELDGYGVLHILSKDPETAAIPFIFLTAKSGRNDVRSGMNLGADDYITKPFDSLDLLKVVEVRLKKSKQLKNNLYDVNDFFNKTREVKEFRHLSENRPSRVFKKKEFVFMEGQTPNDLYFIVSGEVKTYKINYDGKELITGIFNAGDFLGYVSLLEDTAYNENAEVMEEAEISMITKHDFITIMYSNRDIAHKFIKMISNNLITAENRLLDLAYQSVRQRVAGSLLKINSQYHLHNNDDVITITRRDISNWIGTATESLNRTLADFRDEGLIGISSEGIRILNKAKLEHMLHQ